MPTPILNPRAVAWSSYLDTHSELLPAVKSRDRAARYAYQIGQVGLIALIASSHVIANASVGLTGALANLGAAGIPCLGLVGWLGIKVIAQLHEAWRESRWGFSASSLQKIYKAQPDAYDPCGKLRCINCRHTLPKANQSAKPNCAKVSPLAASCGCCGFKLWPGCSKFSALIQNHNGPL